MRSVFITGTDTEVGKTVAGCALVRRLVEMGQRVAALKPVASGGEKVDGALRNADALALMAAANVELPYSQVNPYCFAPAIAPHIAAAQAGVRIDPQRAARSAKGIEADWLLVEGAGGWLIPLNDEQLLPELARSFGCEVILVVGLRLGCINHALLSARQIEADGFRLVGWIANAVDPDMVCAEENVATLKQHLQAPLLAEIPWRAGEPRQSEVKWHDFLA
jgi:dethiobiotin synthetase